MRIHLPPSAEKKPEPMDDMLLPFQVKAIKIFQRQGLDQTELIKAASVPFGRILFDLRECYMNIWTDVGKPEYTSDYADAPKGILFSGSIGVGKTMAMRVIAGTIQGEYFTVPSLANVFSKDGEAQFWSMVNRAGNWDLFLDDLGSEKDSRNFGNYFPIEELLYKRYDLWQQKGVRTHITTNLTGNQISNRYGDRIRDRLREMMVSIVDIGESLRK